jgi:hypothetical protein
MCWCAFFMPMPGSAFTKSHPARMHICESEADVVSAAHSCTASTEQVACQCAGPSACTGIATHFQKHLGREAYEVELPIDIQVLQRDLLALTRAVHLVQHLYENTANFGSSDPRKRTRYWLEWCRHGLTRCQLRLHAEHLPSGSRMVASPSPRLSQRPHHQSAPGMPAAHLLRRVPQCTRCPLASAPAHMFLP